MLLLNHEIQQFRGCIRQSACQKPSCLKRSWWRRKARKTDMLSRSLIDFHYPLIRPVAVFEVSLRNQIAVERFDT